jgi:hypothetical protein
MTMAEAHHIMKIAYDALDARMNISHRHPPVSALKGYDIYQFITASKLLVANEFLLLTGRNDFEKLFEEGLKHYDATPWMIMRFVPDDQVDNMWAVGVFDPFDRPTMTCKDKRFEAEETASSFGNYCRSLGTNDPIYWQKVYTRLGLEYTSISPKGNTPYREGECD